MKNYFPDMADMFRAVHMWTRFHHSMGGATQCSMSRMGMRMIMLPPRASDAIIIRFGRASESESRQVL